MSFRLGIFINALLCLTGITGCINSKLDPISPDLSFTLEYPTENKSIDLGDTVRIIFKANSAQISRVGIQISSDSGLHYYLIKKGGTTVSGTQTTSYTLDWITGKEEEFDIKYLYPNFAFEQSTPDPRWLCRLRVIDLDKPDKTILTRNISMVMKSSYLLRYPIGGETLKMTDSLAIIFTSRSDLTSRIQYFYWSKQDQDWSPIITYKSIKKHHSFSVATERHYFIPNHPDNINPVGDSSRILIEDYSTQIPIKSGWFKLTN